MSRFQPAFGRFHAAISRECLPDRLPNAENDVDIKIIEAFLGKPVTGIKTYASFWEKAGYDYVLLEVRGQYIADSFQKRIADGPEGVRTPDTLLSSSGSAKIKDEKTFNEYPWIGPADVYYKDVDLIKGYVPDGMKLVVSHGPIFNAIFRIMGLEALSVACLENPELIRAMADEIGSLSVSIVENLVQREWVGAIWLGDDIAYTRGLLISPVFLREYIFPFYERIGDLCRRYQKLFIFHSDGKLTEVFEDLLECGVQAIHPNEPTSVDIVELKEQWGDRVALVGNVDVDLLARGTAEEITVTVKRLIDKVAPGGGFVLGSGNSVTDFMPLANYKAMLEAVRKYGNIYS